MSGLVSFRIPYGIIVVAITVYIYAYIPITIYIYSYIFYLAITTRIDTCDREFEPALKSIFMRLGNIL